MTSAEAGADWSVFVRSLDARSTLPARGRLAEVPNALLDHTHDPYTEELVA